MRALIGIAATIVLVSSCSNRPDRLPTAPTVAAVPPAATGAAAGATPITLGQTTAQLLTAADPPCGIQLSPAPPEPCRQFAVSIAQRGVLRVLLTTPGADELTLRVGTQTSWGTTVAVSAAVEPGSTYGIAVGLHSGRGSQSFELTATLEPF